MKLTYLILSIFVLKVSSASDYSNYKVFDVSPNKQQINSVLNWQNEIGIDFWVTGGSLKPSRIMVSPSTQPTFTNFLEQNQIKYKISLDDVEVTIRADKMERLKSIAKRSVSTTASDPDFEKFWTFEQMEDYTIQLAERYPNLVKREVIGKSIEGRDIFGMRISNGDEFGKKPIIFIDAGVHAREWVGPQVALYLMDQLVTNATVTAELVDKVDWVIVPNVNPDGFVYTHTEDRLWRKNRRYVNYTCTGVDLNRNFKYVWRSVPNSCSTNGYPGAHALSEPEIASLAAYMESFKFNLKLYLSTHSYGNLLLWPFGFAFDVYVKNWKEHIAIGRRWVDTVEKATGTSFLLGNSADILYTANGASDDHAIAFANANLAFTLELTDHPAGFIYPQDMIGDLVRETFLGYREFGLYIAENYNFD